MNRLKAFEALRLEQEWMLINTSRIGNAYVRISHNNSRQYNVVVELKGIQTSRKYDAYEEGPVPQEKDVQFGKFMAEQLFNELLLLPSG